MKYAHLSLPMKSDADAKSALHPPDTTCARRRETSGPFQRPPVDGRRVWAGAGSRDLLGEELAGGSRGSGAAEDRHDVPSVERVVDRAADAHVVERRPRRPRASRKKTSAPIVELTRRRPRAPHAFPRGRDPRARAGRPDAQRGAATTSSAGRPARAPRPHRRPPEITREFGGHRIRRRQCCVDDRARRVCRAACRAVFSDACDEWRRASDGWCQSGDRDRAGARAHLRPAAWVLGPRASSVRTGAAVRDARWVGALATATSRTDAHRRGPHLSEVLGPPQQDGARNALGRRPFGAHGWRAPITCLGGEVLEPE